MATIDVPAGSVAAHNVTVTNTVTSVRFSGEVGIVEIVTDGAAALYYTVNGSTPTVGGGNCYLMPAGVVGVDSRSLAPWGSSLQMVADGTCTVSVQRGA